MGEGSLVQVEEEELIVVSSLVEEASVKLILVDLPI